MASEKTWRNLEHISLHSTMHSPQSACSPSKLFPLSSLTIPLAMSLRIACLLALLVIFLVAHLKSIKAFSLPRPQPLRRSRQYGYSAYYVLLFPLTDHDIVS